MATLRKLLRDRHGVNIKSKDEINVPIALSALVLGTKVRDFGPLKKEEKKQTRKTRKQKKTRKTRREYGLPRALKYHLEFELS